MPELLLELGVEELPASFVRRAMEDLLAGITAHLDEAGVRQSEGRVFGTPRRLIVAFDELLDRQSDRQKEQRGPALKAAFGADGQPTQALLGFCRSQGVEVDQLRKDEQYVWVDKTIPGRPTAEILSETLPKAIRGLSFDKSMRWGSSRMRFARPIRWILACFAGEVVPFEIEGVESGNQSRGHRFYAPEAFTATRWDDLIEGLRDRRVEPDPDLRRQRIVLGAHDVASGAPDISDDLLEENTFLTEWPTAIEGAYREEFYGLPEPVLVTAMAKHERMFPVRNADGRLAGRFVFVRNSGEDATVQAGCEWVLNARFNDAKFFYDEDRKFRMDDFLAKTETIVFQERLGSVRARADRFENLIGVIAQATGADERERAFAAIAGKYSKADLATGLVSELSSLQGVIGAEYAKREEFPSEVCHAMAVQYDTSRLHGGTDSADRTAVRLVISDALDKLAGYLGLGLQPSGSSDPFALRRAATTLIEAAWEWKGTFTAYDSLFDAALAGYAAQGVALDSGAATTALAELFSSRYESLLPHVRYDILQAALLPDRPLAAVNPRGVRFRVAVLQSLAGDIALLRTATRPLNIIAPARRKGIAFAEDEPLSQVDLAKLDSDSGKFLFDLLSSGREALVRSAENEDVEAVADAIRALCDPINRFFDGTMIMADDADARYARLTLLQACSEQLLLAGDFSKLVFEG